MLKFWKGRDLRVVMQIWRKFDQSELWDGTNTDSFEPQISSIPATSALTWTRFSHRWRWRQYASPKHRIFCLLLGSETQTWKLSTKYFIFWAVFKHLISNPSEISKILWIGLHLFIIIIIIIIIINFFYYLPKYEKYY